LHNKKRLKTDAQCQCAQDQVVTALAQETVMKTNSVDAEHNLIVAIVSAQANKNPKLVSLYFEPIQKQFLLNHCDRPNA
jgi:hypothetical protein